MSSEMRTIAEYDKKRVAEIIGFYINAPWTFDKWYEKVILWLMGILALWKIYGWIV